MLSDARAGAAVVLEGVSKSFGDALVVNEATFSVDRGTCFGLLGPNGAGKSTTLKMIYGFFRPQAGTVRVEGFDVRSHPREVRRFLGVVPQDDTLDPDLTVTQNLLFHARYFGIRGAEAQRRVDRMLGRAGLQDHSDAAVAELSSGLRRRLVLMRALINDPRVVILDEPTRGLDLESRGQYLESLLDMKRSGVTLLLATHELEEAETLCDRAGLMVQGKILHSGEAGDMVRLAKGSNLLPKGKEAAAC
jgi:lipooligosaccharide transport system ATP-binding protein